MTDPVRYEIADGIATLTLDDGKANVLNMRMIDAINAALDQAEREARAVVISGRPGLFSGGFDLAVFKSDKAELVRMLTGGARLAERLLAFPHPLLAACTGHAVAMGAFVLMCCDVRISVDQGARFHINEVQSGLILPHFVVEVCRARLAPAHFNLATLTALPYTPAQALVAGFIDQSVPAEAVAATTRNYAQGLAQLDRRAFVQSKLRVRGTLLAALRSAIDNDIADWTQQFLQGAAA